MSRPHWTQMLVKLSACDEAIVWAKTQADLQSAWDNCERADWMLWLLARLHEDHKPIIWLACQCARTALKYVPKKEFQARICIETTERWIHGKATIEEVNTARLAGVRFVDAAYTARAAYAAYAAAAAAGYAAYAAAAATAITAAIAAIAAAGYAAYAAAAATAATTVACAIVNKPMAAIIRRAVPDPTDISKMKFTKWRER